MAEMRNLLSFMDKEDRERALAQYEELFARVGPDREEALIASFGAASLKDVQPIHYIPLRDAAAALGADEGGEIHA